MPGERQLARICAGLNNVLNSCEEWFGGHQGIKCSQKLWKDLNSKNPNVVDLSWELGVPPEIIVQRIKKTLTDVSYFSMFRSSVLDL